MRLIDADKLIYQSHAQHLEPYINKKDIDNAPTVEMAEDCVKREDVKKFLYERLDRLNDDELYDIFSKIIDDMYNELPSVTPQTRWNPVSEPPKKSGEYFVDSTFGMAVVEYDADIKSFGWWREEYDCDTLACVDREFIKTEEVLAWRELPQPYKAESEDKE